MSGLKKGDRVTVHAQRVSFNGVIVGEGRTGEWWLVLKDGTKYSQGYAKSFCQPEALPDPYDRDGYTSGSDGW